jgi:ribosomal protein S18 acetylase RimI-like enzyme
MSPAHNSSESKQKNSIVKAQMEHVAGMADCHIAAFEGQFMTQMGFHWLCALYRFFVQHPGGVCFVAVDSTSKVVGFAVGGQPDIREEFLRFAMLRYSHTLFWKFLIRSLVRKTLLDELFKKLRLKHKVVSKADEKELKADGESGSLLSICVLPDWGGTGVADQLIEIFQKTCAAIGFRHLKLSVVSTNSRAIAFYKKHLWCETGVSGQSTRFALDIDSSKSGSDR